MCFWTENLGFGRNVLRRLNIQVGNIKIGSFTHHFERNGTANTRASSRNKPAQACQQHYQLLSGVQKTSHCYLASSS
jgi:hypothetical protein